MGTNSSSDVCAGRSLGVIDSSQEPSLDTRSIECSRGVNVDDTRLASLFSSGDTDGVKCDRICILKSADSNKLVITDCNGDSVSTLINLDSHGKGKKKKKKGGCCGCGGGSKTMASDTSIESHDEHMQVLPLQSAEEIIMKPDTYKSSISSLASLISSEEVVEVKERRTQVPIKPDKPMSLWSLIKSAIGKDLTKLPLPVNFSEPLSFLQRLSEDYEYSSLLDEAAKCKDSLEQIVRVAAFTVSSYASCAYRTAKPFNPLLGETFEFDRTDDLGWRLMSEQVCHHPPIASMHCESARGWVHWQQFTMKSNFRGTCLEIHPLGIAHLLFRKTAKPNHYTWQKVTTIVRNLYMGKLYIELEGEIDIVNHTTGDKCHMKFTAGGMFSRDRTVVGKVYNAANELKHELRGSWDMEMTSVKVDKAGKPVGNPKVIWAKSPLPPEADERYSFSVFTCQLNEPEEKVAPTDSRNRPDQRFMENGLWDEANVEKVRLEDRQRVARQKRAQTGAATYATSSKTNSKAVKATPSSVTSPEDGIEAYYDPCWFIRQRDPISNMYMYTFTGEYWACKKEGNWSRCPKIFNK